MPSLRAGERFPSRELLDARARAGIVGEDDRGCLPSEVAQLAGIGPRLGLVGGDDQATGIGDVPPDLGEPGIGGNEHRGHPLTLGIQGRAPGLSHGVLGQGLAEPGADLVTGLSAPPHFAAVGQEDDRPDNAISQGLGIPVGVVRC